MDELAQLRREIAELRAEVTLVRRRESASTRDPHRARLAAALLAISLAAAAPAAIHAAVQPKKPTYVTAEQVNEILVRLAKGTLDLASRDHFEIRRTDGSVLFRVDNKRLEWNGAAANAVFRVDTQAGAGHLVLTDSEAHPRADLGAGPRGNTALRILNKANVQVAGLGEDPDAANSGALKIHTAQGKIVAGVSAGEGRGFVSVFDPGTGKGIAEMGSGADGRAYISVFNASGISVAALALSDKVANVGRVTVSDAAGKGVFSAGWIGGNEAAACLNGKEGRLWCLGKNLPLGK